MILSRLLLALALAVAGIAVAIYATGGGHLEAFGTRVSFRSPDRAFVVAVVLFFLYARLAPRNWREDLVDLLSSGATATSLAVLVAGAGLFWGSPVGGPADASGYVNHAQLLREGRLVVDRSIIAESPWPAAADTWMPLGFSTSHRPNVMVPTYPPGLPLMMAAMQMIGGFCAAFFAVPITGGLTIWLTYALGRRLFAQWEVASWGALLVATSPSFLFQLMNPMSDVPASAMWTLALVLVVDRRPGLAGLAMSMAIAIRPNLAPLALAPLVWTALEDKRAALRLAVGVVPGVGTVGLLNAYLYGSPFLSGYGPAENLYALAHVPKNVRLYSGWLLAKETPIVFGAVLFFVAPVFVGPARTRHPRLLLGGMLAIVALSYLFYLPFDSWTYLRFFLPVWPVMMVLTSAVVLAFLRRLPRRLFPAAAVVCVAVVTWQALRTTIDHGVFSHWRSDRRYADVAGFITATTDSRAVLISMQHSGALHLYTGRLTLRYERLDPRWLDRVIDFLTSTGRHPYIVLDQSETDDFRRRFAGASQLGRLDWMPIGALSTTTYVYDAASPDRAEPPVEIRSTVSDAWHCPVPDPP